MTQSPAFSFRLTTVKTDKRQVALAFAAVVSVFLPYYLTAAYLVFAAGYTLFSRERRTRALALPHSRLILAVIGAWAFVSFGYGNLHGVAVSFFILCGLLTAFYLRSYMTRRLFDRMMDLVCLFGIAATIVALCQRLSAGEGYRAVSVFSNPNFYGTVMEFTALIALYRLFSAQRPRWFYLTTIASCAVGIYLCASLSAFAFCFAGFLVYLWVRGRRKTAGLLFLGILLISVLVLFVFPWFFPRLGSTEPSFENRLSIWKTALLALPDHFLFGQGPCTYEMIYLRYCGYATSHAHNIFLETMLSYGVVGSSAILFFLSLQVRAALRKVRVHKSSTTNLLLLVMAAVVMLHGLTDVTVVWPQTGLLFLLVYASSGIRTVPQARCFVLRAPELQNAPNLKRRIQ